MYIARKYYYMHMHIHIYATRQGNDQSGKNLNEEGLV